MKNSWRNELCGCNLNMEDLDTAVSEETINRFIMIMKKAMSNEKLTQEEYCVIVDTLITITITRKCNKARSFSVHDLNGTKQSCHIYITYRWNNIQHCLCSEPQNIRHTWPSRYTLCRNSVGPTSQLLEVCQTTGKTAVTTPGTCILEYASGTMITKPGKAVTKVTKMHDKHITTTKIRHAIATAGNKLLTDVERRAVAKGISHTYETLVPGFFDRGFL